MKYLRLRLLALASVSLVAGTAFLLACGDDVEIDTIDEDAGADARPDAPVTDAGADVVENVDSGFTLETFTQAFGADMCTSLARCCYNDPQNDGGTRVDGGSGVDGGTFAINSCRDIYRRAGFELSNIGLLPDGGSAAVLNHAKALECLQKVRALTCNLPASDFQAVRAACFQALQGTKTASQPCANSMDCAPGHFCTGADAGTCQTLRAANAPCGDFTTDPERAEEACSWRASGDTTRRCDSIDFDAGTLRPTSEWKCVSQVGNGSDCANSAWCAEGICNSDDLLCETPSILFNQSSCQQFTNP